MIPQEKSGAVVRGLREAFGVSEFEDIQQITKGHTTSLVYRIAVKGKHYLLKIILRADCPARHYACMEAAAQAGIAPAVLYTSVEDKISITGFIGTVHLSLAEALFRVPALLHRLHSLPPFPEVPNRINTSCLFLTNPGPELDGLMHRVRASNVVPECELTEALSCYEQLKAVYPSPLADRVSSHNDLFKPDNTLFDGGRVWLVDWEAAFLNDRYADLAVVANLVVGDETEERVFLKHYLGTGPGPYELARLFVTRQLTHFFYAVAFLFLGASPKPIDGTRPAPGWDDFRRRIWDGEIDLAIPSMKQDWGRVHWTRFLENARGPRLPEALELVTRASGLRTNVSSRAGQTCATGDTPEPPLQSKS